MSQPSKVQWAEIAKQLDCQFSAVYLCCDGYLVSAWLTRVKRNLKIVVYVNSMIKGEWFQCVTDPNELAEEPRRFLRHSKRQRATAKELKRLERALGKRWCRKKGYYTPIIFPEPYWNSPNSFIRHLKKHSQVIEILDYETYKAAIDVLPSDEEKT